MAPWVPFVIIAVCVVDGMAFLPVMKRRGRPRPRAASARPSAAS